VSRSGDRAARFTDLAARCGDRLAGYVSRRVPTEDIPDVVAATLLSAWRRASLMPAEDDEAFWWLLAIARRTIANHRRGVLRRTRLADRLRALPIPPTPTDDIESRLSVRDAIARLPDDDRELVRLVYWDGLEINAAARVLGIGAPAARKRLQRIRSRLRTTLAPVSSVKVDDLRSGRG
jgi:RNA polymerase sigma-70 factor (ECF subfamily)